MTVLSALGRPDLAPEIQCAAGDVALYLNEPGMARVLFDRVVSSKPDWYRGYLGLASAALLQNDFDPAAKAYWQARNLAPGELKQALSATVGELQKITGYR